MSTGHVGIMWVPRACNFKVSPSLTVASTYMHVCSDGREALFLCYYGLSRGVVLSIHDLKGVRLVNYHYVTFVFDCVLMFTDISRGILWQYYSI